MQYLVMYGEISLKGRNRPFFEKKLEENIRKQTGMSTRRVRGRIIAEGGNPDGLKKVFGISNFAEVSVCNQDICEISRKALGAMKRINGKTMKVIATRADKSFPKTSMEINREIGEILYEAGYKGDMEKPDVTVFVEFLEGKAYLYFKKEQGPGGLPVGSSGKIVSLLSGGIDSPVSTWYALKRGCEAVCLHVHSFRSNKEAEKSKILRILGKLAEFCPSIKCYFVPYYVFQAKSLGVEKKYELPVFRRYLFRLAEKICEKEGAKAIFTGESLGQVASQTLESIRASSEAVKTPILRPLIGFDKEEIICTAKYINTYNLSIEEYKDCCSIIARHPLTKPSQEKVLEAEENVRMQEIIEESLAESEFIRIP